MGQFKSWHLSLSARANSRFSIKQNQTQLGLSANPTHIYLNSRLSQKYRKIKKVRTIFIQSLEMKENKKIKTLRSHAI
jgi:hypothetical protein